MYAYAQSRALVCVCGKTASCASLQVSPLHHLIKGAEKTKETNKKNNHQELKYQQLSGSSLQLQTDLIKNGESAKRIT
mgnify:CR=1 FL=1